VKQQIDVEWKADISRKLENLSELRGLRKDIQRIAVALEKLAGIEDQDSDKELLSWLVSEGEDTEVQESKKKVKQRQEKVNGVEEEEVRGQKEENRIESMEEGSSSFSPVAFSVGTGAF